jgi:hypothetical protein
MIGHHLHEHGSRGGGPDAAPYRSQPWRGPRDRGCRPDSPQRRPRGLGPAARLGAGARWDAQRHPREGHWPLRGELRIPAPAPRGGGRVRHLGAPARTSFDRLLGTSPKRYAIELRLNRTPPDRPDRAVAGRGHHNERLQFHVAPRSRALGTIRPLARGPARPADLTLSRRAPPSEDRGSRRGEDENHKEAGATRARPRRPTSRSRWIRRLDLARSPVRSRTRRQTLGQGAAALEGPP